MIRLARWIREKVSIAVIILLLCTAGFFGLDEEDDGDDITR